jgi:hypothetical protein
MDEVLDGTAAQKMSRRLAMGFSTLNPCGNWVKTTLERRALHVVAVFAAIEHDVPDERG